MSRTLRDDAERLEITRPEQWRAWLAAHHQRPDGLWVVTWKKGSGDLHVPQALLVDQALCFGWIDSLPRRLDEQRTMLWFAPRQPGSGWSRVNKDRLARLEAAGLIAPPGWAAIARAKADGSWSRLDSAGDLSLPDDLAAAFASADPAARMAFDGFPPSARRGLLEWVAVARRPETRARRIAEIVAEATAGRRANRWRGRDAPDRPDQDRPDQDRPDQD